jgi:hypothetical protein
MEPSRREEGAFQKSKGGLVDSRRCEGAKASRIRHRLTQFLSDVKVRIHDFLFIKKLMLLVVFSLTQNNTGLTKLTNI